MMLSLDAWTTAILWLLCFLYLAAGARTADRSVRVQAQPPSFRLLKLVGVVAMFAAIYLPAGLGRTWPATPPEPLAGAAGLVICAAGLLLVIVSRRALGRNWSDLVALKQHHELIERGPYRWVRHPLYSGVLLGLLGAALTVGTAIAYGVAAFCAWGLVVKSRQEEKLLAQGFPAAYPAYRRRVKAFIPFLI